MNDEDKNAFLSTSGNHLHVFSLDLRVWRVMAMYNIVAIGKLKKKEG